MATESFYRAEVTQKKKYFDHLAPVWDSYITEKSLACLEEIILHLNIKRGSHILDLGSGTGVLIPFLIKVVEDSGVIVEMDISEKMLAQARSKSSKGNIHYVQGDVAALPFGNELFDIVICNNAFPHFSHKLKALKEMARVIKKGGRLVICHTMSRESVNNLHRSLGGVIANDFLPDQTELLWLLSQAGFKKAKLENSAKYYLLIAYKKDYLGGDKRCV